MPRPRHRSILAPQIEIHYLELGNPDGLPVFLLHGFPDSPAAWRDVAAHLDLKRLRLILPFVRGVGHTRVLLPDHLSGQAAALASDLLTLADALNLEHFHLVGHDWGARTAFATAVLAPHRVRGVVGLASPYFAWHGHTEPPIQAQAYWYQWYFNTAHGAKAFSVDPAAFAEALWHAWSPRWRFSQEDFAETARCFTNPEFVPIVIDYYRQRWHNAPIAEPYRLAQEILEPGPPIRVPTLFAFGTADACALPEGTIGQAAAFNGPFEQLPLKGLGHFPHREDPKATARLITRLLRQTT